MIQTAQAGIADNALPTWDLTDFYPSFQHATVQADVNRAQQLTEQFSKTYQGGLLRLPAAALATAIREYEIIQELLGKLGSYAQLLFSQDMQNADITAFYQNMSETLNDISGALLFFTLEINQITDEALELAYQESAALLHYAPWLREVRQFRPYQLSQEAEKLLHDKSITSQSAWMRLFDETLSGLVFHLEGEEMTSEQALHRLSDKDPATRKAAAKEIGRVLGENRKLFALITNTLAKDKEIEDHWRKLPTAMSARNLANAVEDDVVDALMQAVRDAAPRLAHRYYRMKARWLHGKDSMDYWDRNAPLPESADKTFSWDEAKAIVLEAYGDFHPRMRELGQVFFDKPWIDVPTRAGKASGAFAHPTVPSVHPYLLLNFQGKQRDVMTLAHELGHGVHQVLSAKQGALMCDTPLTLAETASVFGEQLTFQKLLKQATDPKMRKVMLASKVEDMLNTVVRQVAFCQFEQKLHLARREQGELTPEHIGELWLQVQTESLGPAIVTHPEYAHYWSYIPHFVHTPFYVYAYAFGDCLVNALYTVYQEQPEGFADKYFTMLEAGGTLRHKELLAPFGLDASQPEFWGKGLRVIEQMIETLEALG